MAKAKANNVKLVFPIDYITGDKFDKDAKVVPLSPCGLHVLMALNRLG